jgi:cell division protein FtsB
MSDEPRELVLTVECERLRQENDRLRAENDALRPMVSDLNSKLRRMERHQIATAETETIVSREHA